MIEHLVFLLEEPSAQDFLEAVLPAVLPDNVNRHFLIFEGKQDLERQLVRRLQGWMRPNSQFVVIRDQDSAPCRLIKQRLQRLCQQAGRPDAVIRIACKELEAFFVGDWWAVAQAFGRIADGQTVLLIEPGANGSTIRVPDPDELNAMAHRLNPAEVMLPKTRPQTLEQLGLFA